jgi:hypothetical protein
MFFHVTVLVIDLKTWLAFRISILVGWLVGWLVGCGLLLLLIYMYETHFRLELEVKWYKVIRLNLSLSQQRMERMCVFVYFLNADTYRASDAITPL